MRLQTMGQLTGQPANDSLLDSMPSNMKVANFWKVPIALSVILCSSVPVLLLTMIEHIEINRSKWAQTHKTLPHIPLTFEQHYLIGLLLPLISVGVAVWFLSGIGVSSTRLAWAIFILLALHLFWLSYGVFSFYLTNQTFVL